MTSPITFQFVCFPLKNVLCMRNLYFEKVLLFCAQYISFIALLLFVNNNKGILYHRFYANKWPLCANMPLSSHSFIHDYL